MSVGAPEYEVLVVKRMSAAAVPFSPLCPAFRCSPMGNLSPLPSLVGGVVVFRRKKGLLDAG